MGVRKEISEAALKEALTTQYRETRTFERIHMVAFTKLVIRPIITYIAETNTDTTQPERKL